jgi:hypothetical protein
MQRDLLKIGAAGAVVVTATGAVAWFLPTQTIQTRPAPPPVVPVAAPPPPPAVPAPVAAAPAAPAPVVNPDSDRYAREIESIKLQHKGLQEDFDFHRGLGDVAKMQETIAQMRALQVAKVGPNPTGPSSNGATHLSPRPQAAAANAILFSSLPFEFKHLFRRERFHLFKQPLNLFFCRLGWLIRITLEPQA